MASQSNDTSPFGRVNLQPMGSSPSIGVTQDILIVPNAQRKKEAARQTMRRQSPATKLRETAEVVREADPIPWVLSCREGGTFLVPFQDRDHGAPTERGAMIFSF